MTSKIYKHALFYLSLIFLFICSCRGSIPEVISPPAEKKKTALQSLGYTIQAGAFSDVNNAVHLTTYLQKKGFDAFYFLHESGLYKVRFGNYPNQESAKRAAEGVRANGIITEYMIIRPEDYRRIAGKKIDSGGLRNDLAASARGFIGVPYCWGGVSDKTGFDCSGLTMAVYKLNGMDLPRTTKQQWASGDPIELKKLSEGDLVFFSTKKVGEISHVGIYIGQNEFIHAPGEGKKIRTESLSNEYFQRHYMGARTYLR
jgi:hypothetical protein